MASQVVDVVIKFGGSAITDKSSLETLRSSELSAAALCLRRCTDAGLTCIVVHGAGSFGHHQARMYQVNSGLTELQTDVARKEKMKGFCITRLSVTKLNQFVVNSLLEAGVPATSCSPGSSWETDARQPVKWPHDTVVQILQAGLVPVFHGDCVLDVSMGCCILSGDTIIKTLCGHFKVKRVVFFTDVAGIYDKPPDLPDARLLKTITVDSNGSIKNSVSTSRSEHDVTGGITLKLKTAIDIVMQSSGKCPVHICAVGTADADAFCLGSDNLIDWIGTTVCFKDS